MQKQNKHRIICRLCILQWGAKLLGQAICMTTKYDYKTR